MLIIVIAGGLVVWGLVLATVLALCVQSGRADRAQDTEAFVPIELDLPGFMASTVRQGPSPSAPR